VVRKQYAENSVDVKDNYWTAGADRSSR